MIDRSKEGDVAERVGVEEGAGILIAALLQPFLCERSLSISEAKRTCGFAGESTFRVHLESIAKDVGQSQIDLDGFGEVLRRGRQEHDAVSGILMTSNSVQAARSIMLSDNLSIEFLDSFPDICFQLAFQARDGRQNAGFQICTPQSISHEEGRSPKSRGQGDIAQPQFSLNP